MAVAREEPKHPLRAYSLSLLKRCLDSNGAGS
jgi:hypothetical protein